MRHLTLLVPSLTLVLLTPGGREPVPPEARLHASAKAAAATPNPNWMAEVTARIRDAGHRFYPDGGVLRAEVPERGLSARFDEAGAHIGHSGDPDGTPIGVRATRVGRAGSNSAVLVTSPELGDCQDAKADPEGKCIPRLEYASGGLTEWWEAGSGGFEQGWVLSERPEGDGAVQIAVAVRDADVTLEGERVSLHGDDGSTLVVSRLRAWDARGDDVPARFEHDDDGFRVVVDDTGAVYPVEVDPVYTGPDWSVEGADGYGDAFGTTVAGVGDTNGDGFDDVMVGSDSAAWLFEGSPSGVGTTAAVTFEDASIFAAAGDVNGDGYDDVIVGTGVYLGGAEGVTTTPASSVSRSGGQSAGDVNGDGYDDVVVGTIWPTADRYLEYFSDIYYGSSAGLESTPGTELETVPWPSRESVQGDVSGAGDVDGDGYDDIIVGVYWDGGSLAYGAVWVYLGSASGVYTRANSHIENKVSTFGDTVSGAGDVDGDGYDDVLVGAADGDPVSRVYVYSGSAAGMLTSPSVVFEDAGYSWTTGLGDAGDVNGDGYADILLGTKLYTGSAAGLNTTAAATLAWPSRGAGDTDGDGYDDVIAGEPDYGSDFPDGGYGRAWVYHGSTTATMETSAELASSPRLGISVANGGDVDGDGFQDLIVGADGYLSSTGEALIYRGSASGFASIASTTLVGLGVGDAFGHSVAGAGDANADGYSDIIIGAYGNGGTAYTYSGSSSGLLSTPNTTITGDFTSNGLGYHVAGIGDVNHDGYADVAVASTSGSNYVGTYHGSSSGTSSIAANQLYLAYAPGSIAAGGDVNGDTYDDLIIGCEEYASNTGLIDVYDGSPSGTVNTVSTTLTGESSGDFFGHSAAGAGDVDGDTYDDVVVGAYGHDRDLGRFYVYHGTSTGLSATARTVVDGTAGADQLGAWVAAAGDLDEDGYDDVRVAATGYGSTAGLFVYAGSASGVTGTVIARTTGLESLGDAVTTGDFNGDGLADIVVGDSSYGGTTGEVRGYYGCIDLDGDGYCAAADCDEADASVPFAVYADADGDGYGDPAQGLDVCSAVVGYVLNGGDCDDSSEATHPGVAEVCDEVDNDCNGDIDSDAIDQTTWYVDSDDDYYTDPSAPPLVACFEPDGYSKPRTESDCDDSEFLKNPGRRETCDYLDNDCNGQVDDGVVIPTWYADFDDDGFTDPATSAIDCYAPDGYTAQTDEPDCDDSDSNTYPDADELCNGLDNDCDGAVDEDALDPTRWYPDFDADGYVAIEPVELGCSAPDGYAALTDPLDCDDRDPDIHPGAGDPPADDIDQNCDDRDTIGKACGCAAAPAPGPAWMLAAAGLTLLSRRRTQPQR